MPEYLLVFEIHKVFRHEMIVEAEDEFAAQAQADDVTPDGDDDWEDMGFEDGAPWLEGVYSVDGEER